MHPTIFGFIGIGLSSYAFFLTLAAAIGIGGGYWNAKNHGFSGRSAAIVLAAISVSALFGARLLHVFIDWEFYLSHPARIWALDTVGFSLFGGIILAALTGLFTSRKLKLNAWKLGDAFAPFIGLGIAAMRVGCFLNGCCFGRETDLPWGVVFPVLSPAHRYQLTQSTADMFTVHAVHPTEIYELIVALSCSAFSCVIIKKKFPDGLAILAFLILFSAFRWLNYYLRVPPATFDAPSWFYPSLYFAIIVSCSLLAVSRLQKSGKKS